MLSRAVGGKFADSLLEEALGNTLATLGLQPADVKPLAKLLWLATLFRSGIWTRPPTEDWIEHFAAPLK